MPDSLRAQLARIEAVVLDHLLTGPAPGQCRCGWGQEPAHLGKSHAEHVARMILAALPEADREEVADVIHHNTFYGDDAPDELADALLSRYHLIPKEV